MLAVVNVLRVPLAAILFLRISRLDLSSTARSPSKVYNGRSLVSFLKKDIILDELRKELPQLVAHIRPGRDSEDIVISGPEVTDMIPRRPCK